jgi:phosphatidylinositol alpha-1,6-mannosyltransferase
MTDGSRPRILLVTRNLPPLVGGMERLNWHMADELSRYADVRVIGPAGSAALAPPAVQVSEVPLRPLWKFLASIQIAAVLEARHWRPHWILAGSGLTALAVLVAARTSSARGSAYVHGLDLVVPNRIYRHLWVPALRRLDRVIANSRATAILSEQAGVDRSRIGIVHPGVEIPPELPHPDWVAGFRAEHGLGDRPLLLSVGRLSERKGLREFVRDALPKIAAAHPDVMLLVVGDAPNDALHASVQTTDSIRAAAERGGVAANIKFLGVITDYRKLGIVYCASHVHVFPVRQLPDDPEGFGMVAVEAASHGLPTVAFATGGVTDAVAERVSGMLVAPGDYEGFADAVLETLRTRETLRETCVGFAQRFCWPAFGRRVAMELQFPEPGGNPSISK